MNDSILNKIFHGSAKEILATLNDKSVHCCVTSPPYWNLRDYQVEGQIGLEDTPEDFILRLVEVFREVKRVLRDDGTLWINIGDSYAATGKNRTEKQAGARSNIQGSLSSQSQSLKQKTKIISGLKPKDLVGIPWMLAFALRADGWYLRQDIIWAKPNPMPESVSDRCTKSHEYIFLLSKSTKYYFDAAAIAKDLMPSSIQRINQDIENQIGSERVPSKTNGKMKASWKGSSFDKGKTGIVMEEYRNGPIKKSGNKQRKNGYERGCPDNSSSNVCSSVPLEGVTANKRSVWTVVTKPFTESHFATFPQELIIDCIKAGCKEGGTVLDPFIGSGTTGIVARKINRNFIGIELNKSYIDDIAIPRMKRELGMFY